MVDLSERNRKVANSRWAKIFKQQKLRFLSGKKANLLKARICGFLAGDGSIKIRSRGSCMSYEVGFYPDDKLMLASYYAAVKEVY